MSDGSEDNSTPNEIQAPQQVEQQTSPEAQQPESSGAKALLSGEAAMHPLDIIFQEDIFSKIPDGPQKDWIGKQKNGEGLMKGIRGYQILGSSKGEARPADDAPEEVKEAFNKKIRELNGVPDEADKYEVNLPEGWDMDDKSLNTIKEFAFAEGVPPGIVDKFLPLQVELTKKSNEMATQQHLEGEMQKAAELFGGPDKFDAVAEDLRKHAEGLGYDVPDDMTFRHASAWDLVNKNMELQRRIGELTGEDVSIKGANTGGSRSAMEAELQEFNNPGSDMFRALTDKSNPNNESASKRFSEIIKSMTA